MSFEVDVLRRLAQLEQRSGQIYDQVFSTYVPLSTALTNTGIDGDAIVVGTYTIGPIGSGATYEFDYPTVAKAIYVVFSATWAASADGNYAYMRPNGSTATDACVLCDSTVASRYQRKSGICNLDSSALAQVLVVGANTGGLSLAIMGYFL